MIAIAAMAIATMADTMKLRYPTTVSVTDSTGRTRTKQLKAGTQIVEADKQAKQAKPADNPFTAVDEDFTLHQELMKLEYSSNQWKWKEIKRLREKLRPIFKAEFEPDLIKYLTTTPDVMKDPSDITLLPRWYARRNRLIAFQLALYAPPGSPHADTILSALRRELFLWEDRQKHGVK